MTDLPSHGNPTDRLRVVQISLDESKVYVGKFHAHSDEHHAHKWSIAAVANAAIVGVAVIGRPSSRVIQTDDPWALEVLRVCVERDATGHGHRNACSFLYAAAWRSIKALGYLRALTYTKDGENGVSIRAAGWLPLGHRKPRSKGWDTATRRRDDTPTAGGDRWEILSAAWREDMPARPRVPVPPKTNPGQIALVA